MNVPIRLAWRYAWTRRQKSLTHLISGISMFVIAAVTAAMIAILSAFNGIESVVTDLFGTLDAPIAALPIEGNALPDSTCGWLMNQLGPESPNPRIVSAAPIIEDEAVISWNGNNPQVITVLGFDAALLEMADIEPSLRSGQWFPEMPNGDPCVALGMGVRNSLGMGLVNDQESAQPLILQAPIRGKKLMRHKERAFNREVAFACDVLSVNAEIDRKFILAPLSLSKELFQRPESINRIEILGLPQYSEQELKNEIEALAELEGVPIRIRTRAEKNALITQTNRAEKWATFIILSFILIVAAFNVMASLTMLLLEKRQDIEVLNAMGLSGWRLEQVFAWQGVIINAIGGVIGMLFGIGLVLGQKTFGWVKLEGSVIPAYPVELAFLDVVSTLGVVILIGGIGSGWMVRNLVRRFVH